MSQTFWESIGRSYQHTAKLEEEYKQGLHNFGSSTTLLAIANPHRSYLHVRQHELIQKKHCILINHALGKLQQYVGVLQPQLGT